MTRPEILQEGLSADDISAVRRSNRTIMFLIDNGYRVKRMFLLTRISASIQYISIVPHFFRSIILIRKIHTI